MAFVALTPYQPGIKVERWAHETKSIYPVLVGGLGASAALAFLSQRRILLGLGAANSATLFMARHFSGVMDPDRATIDAEEERRKFREEKKRMTEAKYQTRKKMEADRLLLATGTSFAAGAWATQFAMHAARVFMAPPALATAWSTTASAQVAIAIAASLAMAYKCNVELQIAYCHRFDF